MLMTGIIAFFILCIMHFLLQVKKNHFMDQNESEQSRFFFTEMLLTTFFLHFHAHIYNS
jgi:hypothetical protein